MAEIRRKQTQLVTTNGIDTAALLDNSAYRGIQYNRSVAAGEITMDQAAADAKNHVTSLSFPIITCDKNGDLTSNYTDKEGKTGLAHGRVTASLSANLATMSDIDVELGKVDPAHADMFADSRSKAGVNGTPITANTITVGGKTTFDIDPVALAEASAKERNAANAGKGIAQAQNGNGKARLALSLEPVKCTKDGVGNVTVDSLNQGLVSTATTSYIASNSETHNGGRNAFDKKTIDKAAGTLKAAYDKAVEDVAKALADGKPLSPIVSSKDGKSAIDGTQMKAITSVKLIDVDGVKAFVQNPSADAKTVKDDMKAVASAITGRANAYKAQEAYKVKEANKGQATTDYTLVNATKFSAAAIGLKQTVGDVTKNAGVTVVSPSIASSITPTGANVGRLYAAVTAPTIDDTKKVVGPSIFAEAEKMAKDSIIGPSGLSQEQAREAQNAVIDKVRDAVEAAGKDFDSIGKAAEASKGKGGKQAGE